MSLWISIPVGFIFGWLAGNIFLKLGRTVLPYRLEAEYSNRVFPNLGNIIVKFNRTKLNELITVLIPVSPQRFSAKVQYEGKYVIDGHEVTEKWYESPKWRETGTPEIIINDCGDRILEIFEAKHVCEKALDMGTLRNFSCQGKLLTNNCKIDAWIDSYSNKKNTKSLHITCQISPLSPDI